MGEAEAELEGEMRDFSTEVVEVGASLAIEMAVVTDRRDTRPMRRVVRRIIADFLLFVYAVPCRYGKYRVDE